MADSSREAVGIIEESSWGVTPASALATFARLTGVSGGLARSTVKTGAIRSDYKRGTTVLTKDEGNLTLNGELAYGDVPVSVLAEGCVRSDWTSVNSVTATDISFANVDNSMSSVAETLTVFPAGSWVRIVGASEAANNGFKFVTVSTTSKLTFAAFTDVVDESATASITVDNDGRLREGIVTKSYSAERNFASQSSTPFRVQKGLGVSSFGVDATDGGIVSWNASLMGLAPAIDAAATAGSGAYTAPVDTEMFTGNSNMFAIVEGSAEYPGQVQQVAFALSSGIRVKSKLTSTDPFSIGYNAFDFSGSMSVYKDDNSDSIYQAVVNFDPRFFAYRLTDADGNTYIFTFPRIKYTGGVADNPGNDNEVYQSLPFTIDNDPTYGFMFGMDRFAA